LIEEERLTMTRDKITPRSAFELEAPGLQRLDAWLAGAVPGVSRAEVQRWIRDGAVQIDGRPCKASEKPVPGARVTVTPPSARPADLQAEPIPLHIIYEDDDLLIVNKAAGMTVHPGSGAWSGTLVNALLAHCGKLSVIGGKERPGIVHRLDKDTSGLLVVAKNDRCHRNLSRQIASRSAHRQYLAIVWGQPRWEHATVVAAIGRDPRHRTRMAAIPEEEGGRPAETLLDVRERLALGCVLEATLKTGRTHQIRVHCALAGFPVVGDPVYGEDWGWIRAVADPAVRAALQTASGQALHAWRLTIEHPRTGEAMEFEAGPPDAWSRVRALMAG
jgi:23S rRNA pseudouridine1911/1915/1917 synthase